MHPVSTRPLPDWVRREMAALDGKLAIRWNERRSRWQVMRRRENSAPPSAFVAKDIYEREWWRYVHVFTWENDDGSYRDLDMRLIHALRKGDIHNRDFRVIIKEIEDEEKKLEHEKERQFQDLNTAILEEMRDAAVGKAWAGAYHGGAKALLSK